MSACASAAPGGSGRRPGYRPARPPPPDRAASMAARSGSTFITMPGTAAVGPVVDGAMRIRREIPRIPGYRRAIPRPQGPCRHPVAGEELELLRKQRDDVESHLATRNHPLRAGRRARVLSNQNSGSQSTRMSPLEVDLLDHIIPDERQQPLPVPLHHQDVVGAGGEQVTNSPEVLPRARLHGQSLRDPSNRTRPPAAAAVGLGRRRCPGWCRLAAASRSSQPSSRATSALPLRWRSSTLSLSPPTSHGR
jgi:hypothetical protein